VDIKSSIALYCEHKEPVCSVLKRKKLQKAIFARRGLCRFCSFTERKRKLYISKRAIYMLKRALFCLEACLQKAVVQIEKCFCVAVCIRGLLCIYVLQCIAEGCSVLLCVAEELVNNH
jgi:hypothetical protein